MTTPAERKALGRSRRTSTPRSSHADWSPAPDRPDPVDTLLADDAGRLPWLVPIRHGRMAVSPLAFFRGAAGVMATDLAASPTTGLSAQLCGDAHLTNFGSFASPERSQVFDIDDFDETLPGPWEWDVKRLAASLVLAGREKGLEATESTAVARGSVSAYRRAMERFAGARTLDVWYWQLSVEEIAEATPGKQARRHVEEFAVRARRRDNLRALARLTEQADGGIRIRNDRPLLVPLRELSSGLDPTRLRSDVEQSFARYRESLPDDRRHLLGRFHLVDVALKVVGVGSVGTRCLIGLLMGRDDSDPLFLQAKEAFPSVLEAHLPASVHGQHGERVVKGQRLMQASPDVFLGWSETEEGRSYHWRQLRDMKGSMDVARMTRRELEQYAALCGSTLAHAHARSGDPIAMSAYLGSGDVFDRALTEFAVRYADQSQRDFAAFTEAVATGRVETADE